MKYQYEPLGDEYEFQEFLKDLFNCMYNTNSFEEYGSRGNSQYGVDVYSSLLKIGIQAKKKDILRGQQELVRELLADLKKTTEAVKNYPHAIDEIFFVTTTKKYHRVQDSAISFSQSLKKPVHFFSWSELQQEIAKYPQIRRKYYPHLSTHTSPKELVAVPHIDSATVLGREEDKTKLDQLLLNNRVVCVQSIGGVGKTTFIRSYYQDNLANYDHFIWLDYGSDYKKDLAYNESLAQNLHTEHKENDSDEKRYQATLSKIIGLEGKVLVVIDNLQHEKSASVENEIRKLLVNSGIQIITTSRQSISSFTSLPLEPVEISFARQIFLRSCPKKICHEQLDTLLELVSRNALLTELIAKTINNGLDLSIEKMIWVLTEGDIEESLQLEVEQFSNGELSVGSLYKHLLKIVDVDQLEPTYETYIVCLLSILPANYIPIEEIFSIFLYSEREPQKVLNTINSLHKKGLLIRNEDQIRMHRMIQDVVRMELKSYLIFADILNSIARSTQKANQSFSNQGYRILLHAESILAKVRGVKACSIQQPLLVLKNNLYLMYRYLGEQVKANKLGQELIADMTSTEMLSIRTTRFGRALYHNIATYHFDTGDLPEAEKYFKMAIQANGEALDIDVINSYNGLFNLYYNQRKIKEALEYAGKALEVFKKFPQDDHDDVLANISNNLAMVNMDAGNDKEAAFHIMAAIKLYREYSSSNKNDGMLAGIYSNAALIFSRIKNHEVAIQFALHAIHYRANLKLEDDQTLLEYYKTAALVYENADKVKEAQKFWVITRRAYLR